MSQPTFKRLPKHIGIIPDGNRRWAVGSGYEKQDGYRYGIDPGFELYKICLDLGIQEMTFYGFTMDNLKRPAMQVQAFKQTCIDAVQKLSNLDADLLIVGNAESPHFPKELLSFTHRVKFGKGLMKINFLVNYGWSWDLNHSLIQGGKPKDNLVKNIASSDISRIDLIARWGGRRRLSGFLPVQSVYADFYVLDEMWPDFMPEQFYKALEWYQSQDVTLGG